MTVSHVSLNGIPIFCEIRKLTETRRPRHTYPIQSRVIDFKLESKGIYYLLIAIISLLITMGQNC